MALGLGRQMITYLLSLHSASFRGCAHASAIARDPELYFRVVNMGHEASPRTSPRRGRCIIAVRRAPDGPTERAISRFAGRTGKGYGPIRSV